MLIVEISDVVYLHLELMKRDRVQEPNKPNTFFLQLLNLTHRHSCRYSEYNVITLGPKFKKPYSIAT